MINLARKDMMDIFLILSTEMKNIEVGEVIQFQIEEKDIDYKAWVDLSHIFYCKMLTPILENDMLIMRFKKLNTSASFHNDDISVESKYGVSSTFATIDKNNQPAFLVHYLKALEHVKLDTRIRVLNLGVNSGEEFEVIKRYSKNFKNLEFVGVDYCSSAIEEAKKNFDDENISFLVGDINHLEDLKLGTFDLIISIGTLQSSNLDFNKVFMNIVQNYLKKEGAMILGFPNCRWIDGEMIYGASVPNYNFSELGTVIKDIHFCKKYLQQKKYRVTITGKDYLFLTARKIGM